MRFFKEFYTLKPGWRHDYSWFFFLNHALNIVGNKLISKLKK